MAALFAFATPVSLWMQRWVGGSAGVWTPPEVLEVGRASAVVFGMALFGALLATWSSMPSLADLAREADRAFGQRWRIATAVEVLARGGPTTMVSERLVQLVERDAATWPWMRAAVVRYPGWFWILTIALAIASVAALSVPVPSMRSAGGLGTGTDSFQEPLTVEATVPASDATALGRFAEVLAEVADAESDPYLSAVAASFADLASSVASGARTSVEAARLLEELLRHLGAAAEGISPEFAEAVRSIADMEGRALAAQSTSSDAGEGPQHSGLPSPDVASPTREPAGAQLDPATVEADASKFMALQDLAGEITRDPGSLGLRTPRASIVDPTSDDSFYGGVLRAERDPDAAPAESAGLRAAAEGAGDAVGAAERSTERAGDAAGAGVADAVGGHDRGFADLEADASAVVALPLSAGRDGRFVEVELVPDAVVGAARNFVLETQTGGFDRREEAATTAVIVAAVYRDAVGRYFMPGAPPAGDGP